MKTRNISRRRFLLGLSTAALLASPPGRLLAWPIADTGPAWLSFSLAGADGPIPNPDTLIPLHPPTPLAREAVEAHSYEHVRAALARLLTHEGVSWDKEAPLRWTYQHFGHCGDPTQSLRLLSYALAARDHINEQIPELPRFDCQWQLLADGTTDNELPLSVCRGLIGQRNFLVHNINAVDRSGEPVDPGLVSIEPVERAINYIVDGDGHVPRSSTIYLIHGPTALVAPFSEIVHLHTHQPSLLHADKLARYHHEHEAQMLGRLYGEVISESAGLVLAQQLLARFGQQDNPSYRRMLGHLSHRYPQLSQAMELMRRYSVARILQQYMEDPGAVIDGIYT